MSTTSLLAEQKPSHRSCSAKYYLNKNNTGAYLTQREAECMALFLEGYSAKQASAVLEISERTVEYYLERIKLKLNCYSKRQVMRQIKETEFLYNVKNIVKKNQKLASCLKR